jgi:hypothetical protein
MKAYDVILFGCSRRVGKDTAAKLTEEFIDQQGYGHVRTSFAHQLRTEVAESFNGPGKLPFLDMWTQDDYLKEEVVRPLLIAWGCARRWQDPTYWVKRTITELKARHVGDRTSLIPVLGVVSDWRFPNEFFCFAEQGLSALPIFLERDDAAPTDEEKKHLDACRNIAKEHGLIFSNNSSLFDLKNFCIRVTDAVLTEHCRV